MVRGSHILEKILKNEVIEFFNTSKRGFERKRSHRTLRFLVQATGKMDLPPTEMRKTTVGQDMGVKGGGQEGVLRCSSSLLDIQLKIWSRQLDIHI